MSVCFGIIVSIRINRCCVCVSSGSAPCDTGVFVLSPLCRSASCAGISDGAVPRRLCGQKALHRRHHRSGGGPPASRDAHGSVRHSATQRVYARRAGWPTRRTGGWVGPTATRRGASNRPVTWRRKQLTSRRNKSPRAGKMIRASSRPRRTSEVAARGRRA